MEVCGGGGRELRRRKSRYMKEDVGGGGFIRWSMEEKVLHVIGWKRRIEDGGV